MADTATHVHDDFQTARAAARGEPERNERWDAVEALGERAGRADDVAALYRDVLAQDLAPTAIGAVGRRAAAFIEEWFPGDDGQLSAVLRRVLAVQPDDSWAFLRLTAALTLAERWDDLLALYDQTLVAPVGEARRVQLLEEAADAARDFAGQPDRAVGYMQQLLELRPSDTRLEAALERLLEKQGRWRDLVNLYKRRIELQGREATEGLPIRIAEIWLDKLHAPDEALEEVRRLLADSPGDRDGWALLERVLVLDGVADKVRAGTLDLLRSTYDAADKPEEVIRVLGVALRFADRPTAVELHRELARRLVTAGRKAESMDHYVSVLSILPDSKDDHLHLRQLAEQSGEHLLHVKGLLAAAEAEGDAGRRAALWAEAGDVHREALADASSAIELYQRALAEPKAAKELALRVARALDDMLEEAGRAPERLGVLERLGELEAGAAKAALLGEAARLAASLGDRERALGSWRARLSIDADDPEALAAGAELLEQLGRWDELAELLRQRAMGPVADHQRLADLRRVADIQAERLGDLPGAIGTWQEVARSFGESDEAVESLADLLGKVTRWPDLADLLDRASGRETARLADLSSRLGDVLRAQLGRPTRAVACYDTALTVDPAHQGARAGLLATLDTEGRAQAVEVLGKLYRARGEWLALAEIAESRLAVAPDAARRVEVLRETASIREEHGKDPAAALAAVARAFPLQAGDRAIERDLVRLAEATGDYLAAADAYAAAASASAGDGHRAAELRLSEARIAEHKLSDHTRSLAAYKAVLAALPGEPDAVRGAVRSAAVVGDFSAVAQALLGQIGADQKIDPSLVALVETLADERGGWEQLTLSLEAGAEAAHGSLTPELYGFVTARVAVWHRDRRGDSSAAREALQRSVHARPGHHERLTMLAELQRAAPDTALIETLQALDHLSDTDFDALYEASELALGLLGDSELTRQILTRLLERASALWNRGVPAGGARTSDVCVAWSAQKLAQLHEQAGDRGAAADLLARTAALPFAPAVSQGMRLRAAAIFAELGQRPRAIELYQSVVDEVPGDLPTVRTLAPLLEAEERFPELLKLRQHELSRVDDGARKLELRLDIARLVGVIEERGGRIEALRQNLAEDPSHDPSLAALIGVLASKASPDDLAQFLGEHAERLEQVSDKDRAVRLWTQLAELAETRLGDNDRAIEAHRRVVKLEPSTRSLDALARLFMGRAEPHEAVPWLSQRLDLTPEGVAFDGVGRTDIVLRLTDALLGSGAAERAVTVLQGAFDSEPAEPRTRDPLLKLLRDTSQWETLASTLQTAAESTSDRAEVLSYLYEASAIVRDRLGALDRAIPVLEKLHAMVPDDRGVQQNLADALLAARRYPEAQTILEKLLADFGRRRPPERARVHFKLAEIARAQGDRKAALTQLELATAIDIGDVASLQMLAELSRETGDLARAERSYRALLLAARRRGTAGDEKAIGISEAQYELSKLAEARGQTDLAGELLESAVNAALQDDREARKLQRALQARGDAPLLVRVLRSRLQGSHEPPVRAQLLSDLADALAATGKDDEALGLRLQALQDEPGAAAFHKSAAELSARLGQSQRYVDAVLQLVDRARRKAEAPLQADLLLRAGEIVEREFDDKDRAAELYGRAEASGHRVVEAWMGLARIAAARGDSARQVELLERIAAAPDDAMSPETRATAAFGLAEIHLASADSRDAGVAAMRRALEAEPRHEVAEPILRRALQAAPDHAGLVELYEQVVRAIGDQNALLSFLERRANAEGAEPRVAHEAAELAQALGEIDRAEQMMGRTLELARQGGDNEHGVWALLSLAERRKRVGDLGGSIAYMRDAAAIAEPGAVFALGLELAGLAAEQDDKIALAGELYEELLQQDPSNRAVWGPLMDVYRKTGDQQRLQHLVEATLPTLADPKERNGLRLELIHALLATTAREQDAVRLLKDMLLEEPGHREAERLLAEVFERTGYDAELVELLQQQLMAGQEANDPEAVVAASLRLGDLLRRTQPDEALGIYRTALDFAPTSRPLIEAMLTLFDSDHDPRERAEITERLLAVETGEAATTLALDLARQYDKLGDKEAVTRVLERGYKSAPDSAEIRGRLESWYRDRGDFERLAALLVESADRALDPEGAVQLLREASTIYADQLMDTGKAAQALHAAVVLVPTDVDLLREYIDRLCDTGEHAGAIEQLTKALDWKTLDKETTIEFLRRRAELRMIVGDEALAAADLEEAHGVGGAELIPDLIDGLERWRAAAARRSDKAGERSATLRLVDILRSEGAEEQARHALAGWVERAADDTEALRALMAIDTAGGRWETVIETCTKLVAAETGDAQIKAALQLVEACEKVGRPNDAQAGLEAAHRAQPGNDEVRARLKEIYEETENYPALARLLIAEAGTIEDDNARFLMLRQAGELLLDEDAAAAADALKQALVIRPADQAVNILLVEAYTGAEQFDQADAILDAAIEAMKGRRSPELCVLQYRKAMVAEANGNQEQQLHWLKEAHNTDRNNGDVAVALAALAEKLEDYDLAIRVLRSIALMEAAPMSRAVAYLRQGYIAERRGDRQKAVLWGRKALMEDPNCTEATDFLRQIGEI